ncbi:MAG: ParB/RepB/Spo0J family partition protein [Clostridia bacterium]|nr:ParB/RepB/Spo0J family partition protein [Clostridia bacterium]
MTELRYFKKLKPSEEEPCDRVVQVKTDDIRPNRAQPRADFDQNAIIRLADSIRRYGILQPLTVRQSDPDDIYGYELIAGERRLRAAKMLGYLTVPCVIMEVSEQVSAELAIIENLLREDLNMFEQAYGFRKLIENHNLTQEEVARRMSLSQSAVANKLRLLRLSYEEQRLILESGLTERHARATLRLDDPKRRINAIREIAENKWNVQAAEHYIEELVTTETSSGHGNAESSRRRERVADAFADEKELMDMVQALRHKVDAWNKGGKSAVMTVANGLRAVEVTIRFDK